MSNGIDAAVTWLGTQSWSNGKVGIIGKSYDGSTPWQAATFGNPHLATIVPMSGLIGVHELMWRNGSMELEDDHAQRRLRFVWNRWGYGRQPHAM